MPNRYQVVNAPCSVCHKIIRMGPIFDGRYLEAQDVIVCNACCEADRNGWRSEYGLATDAKAHSPSG